MTQAPHALHARDCASRIGAVERMLLSEKTCGHSLGNANVTQCLALQVQLPLWDGATGRRVAPETDKLADAVRDALMDDAAQLAEDMPEEAAGGEKS